MFFKKIIKSVFLSTFMFLPATMMAEKNEEASEPIQEESGEPMDFYDESSEFEALFNVTGEDILKTAERYMGTPYRMGATGPTRFDCSGFTSYVYKKQNIQLNRTSRDQYTQGVSINKDEVRPGDLVFFGSRRSGKGVGHVGIVYSVEDDGSFKFVHASCKHGVTISRSTDEYYTRMYRGARRILAY